MLDKYEKIMEELSQVEKIPLAEMSIEELSHYLKLRRQQEELVNKVNDDILVSMVRLEDMAIKFRDSLRGFPDRVKTARHADRTALLQTMVLFLNNAVELETNAGYLLKNIGDFGLEGDAVPGKQPPCGDGYLMNDEPSDRRDDGRALMETKAGYNEVACAGSGFPAEFTGINEAAAPMIIRGLDFLKPGGLGSMLPVPVLERSREFTWQEDDNSRVKTKKLPKKRKKIK